jgi:hypothetical protein
MARLRAETQIRQWYRADKDQYLLVIIGGSGPFGSGTAKVHLKYYRRREIDGLDRIPEREVKTEAGARKIWGCPPLPVPSRWERILEDDDETSG